MALRLKDGALLASSAQAPRPAGLPLPAVTLRNALSAEASGGRELALQAQGTGLGPDNPRSKQPVSSVS